MTQRLPQQVGLAPPGHKDQGFEAVDNFGVSVRFEGNQPGFEDKVGLRFGDAG